MCLTGSGPERIWTKGRDPIEDRRKFDCACVYPLNINFTCFYYFIIIILFFRFLFDGVYTSIYVMT